MDCRYLSQGEIEALRDGVRQYSPQSINSLHEEVMRLGKLINDLHELSMSDAGALNYKFEHTDLARLLADEVQRFSSQATQQNLRLELQLPTEHLPLVSLDQLRISQLINNLIENSLRYTDAGGRVVVSLFADNKSITLTVADSAPSVSVQDCAKLFDRLYRVNSSRSRSSGGSGLGLAIVKNIANAHRGKVTATPSELGGLAITVELPR